MRDRDFLAERGRKRAGFARMAAACAFLPAGLPACAAFLRLFLAAAGLCLMAQGGVYAAPEAAPLAGARAAGAADLASAAASAADGAAEAGKTDDAEKSWFLSFVEAKLSAPNRRISISHIDGVLSSRASIGLITVADAAGVWLRIRNAALDWNRLSLLRGEVSVNSLSADTIEVLRKPLPNPDALSPEASGFGFSLPQLPVGIDVRGLKVRQLLLGQELAGQAAALSLSGRLALNGKALDMDLSGKRLDGAGGDFRLAAHYNGGSQDLALDMHFDEPQGGILAAALALEGRPSLHFKADGGGKAGLWNVTLHMEAANRPILDGVLTARPADKAAGGDSRIFNFAAAGPIAALLPPVYRPFFGAKTSLSLHGAARARGGVRIDRAQLSGGCVYLSAAGETADDGFLRRLSVKGAVGAAVTQEALGGACAADAAGNGLVVLPVAGGQTKLGALRLDIAYGAPGAERWFGRLNIDNLHSAAAQIKNLRLDIGGAAEHLDNAAARHISAFVKGGAVAAQGAGAKPAQIDITANSDWRARQPLVLRDVSVNGAGLMFSAQGAAEQGQFSGTARLMSANIADFAQIFGMKLAGRVNLGADGAADLLGRGFDVTLSGGIGALKTEHGAVNALLDSDIAVSGGLKRDGQGLAARNLRVANSRFQLFANGDIGSAAAHLDFGANLADLALLKPFLAEASGKKPDISGALRLRGAARGHNGLIALAAHAALAKGRWNGRPVRGLRLAVNGALDNTSPIAARRSALLRGEGQIDGEALQLYAALHDGDKGLRLDSVNLSYGQALLRGFLHAAAGGLWNGEFTLKADDIAPLAALGFMEGRGKADVTARLAAEAGGAGGAARQNVYFRGAADGVMVKAPFAVGQNPPLIAARHLRLSGQALNIFALPQLTGSIDGQDLRCQNYGFRHFAVESAAAGQASRLNLSAEADNGARLLAQAELSPLSAEAKAKAETGADAAAEPSGEAAHKAEGLGGWQLVLNKLSLSDLPVAQAGAAAEKEVKAAITAKTAKKANGKKPALVAPLAAGKGLLALQLDNSARFVFFGRELRSVDKLAFHFARDGKPLGQALFSGRFAEPMNADAELRNAPLELSSLFLPDLGLRGALSGTAHISGAFAAPIADFAIELADAAAAPSVKAGLPPLNLSAKGRTDKDVLTLSALLVPSGRAAAQNMQLRAAGQVFWTARKLDLTADMQAAPLSLLSAMAGSPALNQQKLSGALNAHAVIEGSFANPRVRFQASAAQLSAAALQAGHIAPLNISAAGAADRQALALENFTVQGGGLKHFSAAGRLPYQGQGVDMQAKGSLPLAVFNGFLAERGAQLSGQMSVDAHMRGAWQNPQMQGNFAISGGQFIDAVSNLRLKPINLAGRLSGNQLIVEKLEARSYNGGAAHAAGTLSADSSAGFPVSLRLNLNHFGYNDGATVAAQLSGALTVSGALMNGAEIGGKVTVNRAEIRVPDSFGGASMLDIENRRGTPAIMLTQKRAGMRSGKAKKQAEAAAASEARFMPRLDIEIAAPNKIFVRGRGLDAEMGGALRITGRADALSPTGGFKLIRGRLDILAQRLVFRSGEVSLAGNFSPSFNFAAVSNGDDVTVTITVSGTPKDLKISLSSDPSLPQDEILARLIFKRSLSELSPIQVAQLVDATAELTGLTQHSVMGRLRSATGLDQLDITTDSAGNAGVAAGRYIMNKLYLGVETSSSGASKGTVNLDITPRLKAKGAVGSDANSNIGVFYERDY